MNNIIAKIKANTKAWVSGIVTFVCTYVVLFVFGIEVTADLQATIASGLSAVVAFVLTWAFPNVPPAPPPSGYMGSGFDFQYDEQVEQANASDFKQTTGTEAERWLPPAVPSSKAGG